MGQKKSKKSIGAICSYNERASSTTSEEDETDNQVGLR